MCPGVLPRSAKKALMGSTTSRQFKRSFFLRHSSVALSMMVWGIIMPPTVRNGTISVAFVRPSVCSSVAYIANNSRTQRPSVPQVFRMKVPRLRCDSHTSFKVKRSKVRVTDGRGHTVSAKPGAHTACYLNVIIMILACR